MSNVVALLPLKAHSERVPNKNFRRLGKKPLYRWMLDTLLEVERVQRIVINTDAIQILEEHGLPETRRLLLRERPHAIRGDHVSMNRIIEDDLESVGGDVFVQTHVTNPFLRAKTVDAAINRHIASQKEGRDSLFTVTRHQGRFYTAAGDPVNHDPSELLPTQELAPLYEENSNLYVFTRRSFSKRRHRIGENPELMETEWPENLDIDVEPDWEMAVQLEQAQGHLS